MFGYTGIILRKQEDLGGGGLRGVMIYLLCVSFCCSRVKYDHYRYELDKMTVWYTSTGYVRSCFMMLRLIYLYYQYYFVFYMTSISRMLLGSSYSEN